MKIIAFGHRKRVGKDLSGELLYKNLIIEDSKRRIQKAAFAEPMYKILHDLYGWAGFRSYDHYLEHGEDKSIILEALGKTPRDILIEFGTHCMRDIIYDGTWVDYLLKNAVADILIITDLRFPNEFSAIKEAGGYCVKIDRPEIPITNDIADNALSSLPNSSWDLVIENTGSKRELNDKVLTAWSHLCSISHL